MGLFDGPIVRTALAASPGGIRQPNAESLGRRTGAPPRTVLRTISVPPGTNPTRVVEPTRESRVIILTAPAVAFSIYVGDTGVDPSKGYALPANVAQEFVLPGFQELWVVTDSPAFIQLRIQIAPILIGDTERE